MLKNLQMAYLLTELPYLKVKVHIFLMEILMRNWNMLLVLMQYLQEKSFDW